MAERDGAYKGLAGELVGKEDKILKEMLDCQGPPVDIGEAAGEGGAKRARLWGVGGGRTTPQSRRAWWGLGGCANT
jgi:hypothetical protein